MKKYTKDELAVIFLDAFEALDYNDKSVITEEYLKSGSLSEALSLDRVIKSVKEEKLKEVLNNCNKDFIDGILEKHESYGVTIIPELSEDFPEKLKDVVYPPHAIYVKGDSSLMFSERTAAVIGSRKSLPVAKETAKRYAEELTAAGITVVTGIAEGVEENVIKSAVKSGKIISVTAGGLDCVYPKENAAIFEETGINGLVISEYPLGVKPKPYFYPMRNRLIAGLADTVVVISAGLKSGTFHTVGYALDQGKDVFVVPYNVGVASGEGCNKMIKSGAYLTDEPQDILTYFGIEKKDAPVKEANLTQAEERILGIVKEEGNVHIDKLSDLSDMQIFELLPVLSMLELKGLLIKDAGNFYSCAR